MTDQSQIGSSDNPDSPDIYTAIGRAISTWAMVEEKIFEIYVLISRHKIPLAAQLFYMFKTFNAQLNLVSQHFTGDEKLSSERVYWDGISSVILDLSRERNFIAHNPVGIWNPPLLESGYPDMSKARMAQIRGGSDPQYAGRPIKAQYAADIVNTHIAFSDLLHHLSAFFLHLYGTEPSPNRFHAPFADPQLQKYGQLRNAPKGRKRQPPPSRP